MVQPRLQLWRTAHIVDDALGEEGQVSGVQLHPKPLQWRESTPA